MCLSVWRNIFQAAGLNEVFYRIFFFKVTTYIKHKMSLLKLPTELLELIAINLSNEHLSLLLQVNSRLYNILLPYLYQRQDKMYNWPASFMRAVATGNERGSQNFLYYGADVNIICNYLVLHARKVPVSPWFDLQTPLNVAAGNGNDAMVMMLLDRGADINGVAQKDWGRRKRRTQPAVVDALLSGYESTVRILLERGSDIQGPHIEAGGLVSCAVETGQLAMLKLLVEFGADMNIPHDGVYPLLRAVCSKRVSTDIARFLLDNGAEIAPTDEGHKRIMEQVVERGTVDTARLLLERGAIYPQDNFPYAVAYSSVDCIRLLIEYGIKPGIESLTRATKSQRLEMVQVLLEEGFDLNTRDSRGSTILHYAVTQCGFEWPTARLKGPICILPARRQLVRDMKVIPTQNVPSPCRIPEIQRDIAEEIMRYLIDKGADVNAMNGQGRSPLYLAQKYAPAAEQILLDNGAVA